MTVQAKPGKIKGFKFENYGGLGKIREMKRRKPKKTVKTKVNILELKQ